MNGRFDTHTYEEEIELSARRWVTIGYAQINDKENVNFDWNTSQHVSCFQEPIYWPSDSCTVSPSFTWVTPVIFVRDRSMTSRELIKRGNAQTRVSREQTTRF